MAGPGHAPVEKVKGWARGVDQQVDTTTHFQLFPEYSIGKTRSSSVTEGTRDTLSVEILLCTVSEQLPHLQYTRLPLTLRSSSACYDNKLNYRTELYIDDMGFTNIVNIESNF